MHLQRFTLRLATKNTKPLSKPNIRGIHTLSSKTPTKTIFHSHNWNQNAIRNIHSSKVQFASAGQDQAVGGIIQFKLADIGEGIAECEVLKWLVKEGDKIAQFDPLCEVQSDKATVEITSRYDGIVKKLHYKKGDMAKVGSPLVDIDTGNNAPVSTATISPTTPESSEDIVVQSPGATSTGSISKVFESIENEHHQHHQDNEKVLATPAVRHLARKYNLALKTIIPSGRDGRVLKEDILKYLDGGPAITAAAAAASSAKSPSKPVESAASAPKQQQTTAAPQPSVTYTPVLEDRVVPLSGYSRIMAKTMTAANAIPHFGYSDEIVADSLIKLRSQLKGIAEKQGIKLTFMPFIIKATSQALLKYPVLNSSYDEAKNAVIYKAAHNIGVAMDTPNGLVVPNIKNVQNKSIMEIAVELNRLQAAASKAGFAREDLSGGTFTLSNIGTIGGTYASPVLVVPEVAIGAIGKIQKLPRFDHNGQVIPINLFNISWSADHRVIDGATMAHFSNAWKNYLENPSAMLLETR